MAAKKCKKCDTELKKGTFTVNYEYPEGMPLRDGRNRGADLNWCPKCDEEPYDGMTIVGLNI